MSFLVIKMLLSFFVGKLRKWQKNIIMINAIILDLQNFSSYISKITPIRVQSCQTKSVLNLVKSVLNLYFPRFT